MVRLALQIHACIPQHGEACTATGIATEMQSPILEPNSSSTKADSRHESELSKAVTLKETSPKQNLIFNNPSLSRSVLVWIKRRNLGRTNLAGVRGFLLSLTVLAQRDILAAVPTDHRA